VWLRLISWIDDQVFSFVKAEGWQHALGYYAARDPRLDRVRAYWSLCDDDRTRYHGGRLTNFDEWRRAALEFNRS
jgi:hypothetical protein